MPTNKRETEIIMEHVFKDNENLEVALDIISRTQEIRKEIIKSFLEKLKGFICKKFICKKLDMSQWDWETELYDKPFEGNNYHSFGIKFGQEPIVISLSGNPTGNNLYIYIAVLTTNKLFHKTMNHLRSTLDKAFGQGDKPEGQWFWSQFLKSSDYADWYNKDTLIKMRTDPCRVVEDIGNRLLEIIEVAKPEIEKWAQQNPSAQ